MDGKGRLEACPARVTTLVASRKLALVWTVGAGAAAAKGVCTDDDAVWTSGGGARLRLPLARSDATVRVGEDGAAADNVVLPSSGADETERVRGLDEFGKTLRLRSMWVSEIAVEEGVGARVWVGLVDNRAKLDLAL